MLKSVDSASVFNQTSSFSNNTSTLVLHHYKIKYFFHFQLIYLSLLTPGTI